MLTPRHRAFFAAAYSAQLLRKPDDPPRRADDSDTAAKSKEDKGKGEVRTGEMPAA